MHAEVRIRSEPRLTVPEICPGFIADSLFAATLVKSCKTKGPFSGLQRKPRREKMVGDIDPDSGRPLIMVNNPVPTYINVGTI